MSFGLRKVSTVLLVCFSPGCFSFTFSCTMRALQKYALSLPTSQFFRSRAGLSKALREKFHIPIGTRSLFIQTETTPNPQSMKFISGKEVLPEEYGTGMYFEKTDKRELQKSPLASGIFQIPGVKSVFFSREVVTVTKESAEVWQVIKPQIFATILDFYASGDAVVSELPSGVTDTTILDDDDEVVALIKELMETRVRPAVQDDGGDIYFEGFDENSGIVKVRLAGSCVGCPSSSVTLRNGVERMLMHYIPEVKGIEEVGALEDDEDDESQIKMSFKPDGI